MRSSLLFLFVLAATVASLPVAAQTLANAERQTPNPPAAPAVGDASYSVWPLRHGVVITRFTGSSSALWFSDGTSAGTRKIAELCAPSCDGELAVLGTNSLGLVGIVHDHSGQGWLWISDGTEAGTDLVLPLPDQRGYHPDDRGAHRIAILDDAVVAVGFGRAGPGIYSATASGLERLPNALGNTVVRAGNRALIWNSLPEASSTTVWTTDGTPAGTHPSVQLPYVLSRRGVSLPSAWIGAATRPSQPGSFVVATDGTASGTTVLAEHPAGYFDVSEKFEVLGIRAYWEVQTFDHETELWRTSGSAASTQVLGNYRLAPGGGSLASLGTGSYDFLGGSGKLIAFDGNGTATTLVSGSGSPYQIRTIGDAVWTVSDGSIWMSGGTPATTSSVSCGPSCEPDLRTARRIGDSWWMSAYSGSRSLRWHQGAFHHGPSTLTLRGPAWTATSRGRQFAVIGASDRSFQLQLVDSSLSVQAVLGELTAPIPARPTSVDAAANTAWACIGTELWRLDHHNTRRVLDNTDCDEWYTPLGSKALVVHQGQVVAVAADGTVEPLPDYPTRAPVVCGDYVVTGHRVGDFIEIWSSDATAAGTRMLGAFESLGVNTLYAPPLSSLGPVALLRTEDLANQDQYWIIDPHSGQSHRDFLDVPSWVDLRTDSTARHQGSDYALVSGAIYRVGPNPVQLVGQVSAGSPAQPRQLVSTPDELYVVTPDHSLNVWAWSWDSLIGAIELFTLPAGRDSDRFPYPRAVGLGNGFVFSASDVYADTEPWIYDPHAGPRQLRDIHPGPLGSNPREFFSVGYRVFFSADDGRHGLELWETDGTSEGTRMVQDLNPGPAGSAPQDLALVEGRLVFSAEGSTIGRTAWMLPLDAPTCDPSRFGLCLGDTYRAEMEWRDFSGGIGRGTPVPLTADSGAFWFFNDQNLETIVKVLDGRGVNGHEWVFFGSLTNVDFALTVTDVTTGASRRWINPPRNFASAGDTEAFGPRGAGAEVPPYPTLTGPGAEPSVRERRVPNKAGTTCVPSATRLCLNGGRFAVEATWEDFSGGSGVASTRPITDDTGALWFFDQDNLEVLIKVLDGRAINNAYWVFYGAISNVAYELVVTDLEAGIERRYTNPSGRFGSVGDTAAFPQ